MADEIKQFFQSYRSPTWMLPPELPQEGPVVFDNVAPTGWVVNSSANVIIDDEGLHIFDGAIFLTDDSGESVLSSAGFSGSWLDFLRSGIYNGTFSNGIAKTVAAPAMEEIILQGDLPYWEVIREGGATTVNSQAFHASATDADYMYEVRLSASGWAVDSKIGLSQLVPISNISARRGNALPGGGVRVTVSYIVESHDFDHKLELRLQQFGLSGTGNTLVALGTEATSQEYGEWTSTPNELHAAWVQKLNLDPKCTHIRIQINLWHYFATGTGAIVRIRNVELDTSVSSVILSSAADGSAGPGLIYMEDSTVPAMNIDPGPTALDADKKLNIDANVVVGGNINLGSLTSRVIGFLDFWQTPTLINGWVAYGAGYPTAQYRRDAQGYVHMRGLIKNGTVNTAAFTLPVNYRPSEPTVHVPIVMNAAFGYVGILANGNVEIRIGSNVWADLTGVIFKAEA